MTREEFSRNARLAAYKARQEGFYNAAEALNSIADSSIKEFQLHIDPPAMRRRRSPAKSAALTKNTL